MYLPKLIRNSALLRQMVAVVLCGLLTCNIFAQGNGNHPNTPRNMPLRGQHGGFGQPKGQHLPQWFADRRNLTPKQREDALRREPGFRQMSPEAQHRALDGLQRLNNMTPPQRQRFLARNEVIEGMSPDQRRQFRGALQSVKEMPADRRMVFSRSFRELRKLPPDQRSAVLNSPQYRSQLSDDERRNLDIVLSAEPQMIPSRAR